MSFQDSTDLVLIIWPYDTHPSYHAISFSILTLVWHFKVDAMDSEKFSQHDLQFIYNLSYCSLLSFLADWTFFFGQKRQYPSCDFFLVTRGGLCRRTRSILLEYRLRGIFCYWIPLVCHAEWALGACQVLAVTRGCLIALNDYLLRCWDQLLWLNLADHYQSQADLNESIPWGKQRSLLKKFGSYTA